MAEGDESGSGKGRDRDDRKEENTCGGIKSTMPLRNSAFLLNRVESKASHAAASTS